MNFFLILIFIEEVNLQLTREKREELMDMLVQKMDFVNLGLYDSYIGDNIEYDIVEINNLIEKYGFPKEYNYFEDTGKTPIIKNQGSCGCCWAMASTTALSYRYYKIGIDVNLSPQELVSCYMKSCEGNNKLDSQLYLVKNGTVTEECMPFSSLKGEIEECPTSCKDGSDIKKRYYAKNSYIMNLDFITNYYDAVTLIMDQLINFGPVVTNILAYDDFHSFFDKKNCPNEVYTYNGWSQYSGGHSMVIVGYGFLNNKYYWLIQNSWDKGCDNGLVKIEFGQVDVELVSFSEPYIEDKNATQKRIDLTLHSFNYECNLKITTESSLDDWISPLSLRFENSEEKNVENYLRYICGVNSLYNDSKVLNCYYEYNTLKFVQGEYKLKDYESLGKENTFYIKDLMETIYIYGIYDIETITDYPLYFSEIGSRIIFQIKFLGLNDSLPSLFFYEQKKFIFLNCNIYNARISDFNLIYCDFGENELNFLKLISYSTIGFTNLCGLYYSNIKVIKLDKEKYPVFRIKNFLLSSNDIINNNLIRTMIITDIEGSISNFKNSTYSFEIIANIEKDNKNITTQMQCSFESPNRIKKNYIINCTILQNKYDEKNNYYILPLYYTKNALSPFEIIIDKPIKSIDIPFPTPNNDKNYDNKENNILVYRIITIALGLLTIILIIIIIKMCKRLKQKNSFISGQLLNKDEIELKD